MTYTTLGVEDWVYTQHILELEKEKMPVTVWELQTLPWEMVEIKDPARHAVWIEVDERGKEIRREIIS